MREIRNKCEQCESRISQIFQQISEVDEQFLDVKRRILKAETSNELAENKVNDETIFLEGVRHLQYGCIKPQYIS